MSETTQHMQCRTCGLVKPVDTGFYKPNKRGIIPPHCKVCNRQKMLDAYYDKRKMVDEIKLASGCVDCGFNGFAEALEFDHLPGFDKVRDVAKIVVGARGSLLEEIAKCEVVCANCHRVRTVRRRQEAQEAERQPPDDPPWAQLELPA